MQVFKVGDIVGMREDIYPTRVCPAGTYGPPAGSVGIMTHIDQVAIWVLFRVSPNPYPFYDDRVALLKLL